MVETGREGEKKVQSRAPLMDPLGRRHLLFCFIITSPLVAKRLPYLSDNSATNSFFITLRHLKGEAKEVERESRRLIH